MIGVAVKKAIKDKRDYKGEIIYAAIGFAVYFLLYRTNESLGFGLALGVFAAFLTARSGFLFQSTAFLLASLFGGELVCSAVAAAVIAPFLAVSLLRIENATKRRLVGGIIIVVAQILYIATSNSPEVIILRIAGIPLSLLAAYSAEEVLKEIFSRGVRCIPQGYKLLEVYFLIGTLCGGLHNTEIFGTGLSALVIPFAILGVLYILGKQGCIAFAIVAGTGCALFSGDVAVLALYAFTGMAVSVFYGKRYVGILVQIAAMSLFFLFFGDISENILYLLFGCVSAVAFASVPSKPLNKIKSRIMSDERVSARHIVNRQRSELSRRLYELSEVFFAMQLSFKSMVRGVMPPDKAAVVIARDVCGQVCGSCGERMRCWRTLQTDTEKGFFAMTEAALDKGRATVIDVNNALAARCGRINSLLAAVNVQADSYKRYFTMTINSDNGKNLIAEQMQGVSMILRELSNDGKKTVCFDDKREREIISGLNQRGVLCKEAVLYDDGKELKAALLIDKSDTVKPSLSQIVSDTVKTPLMIERVESTQEEDWKVVHFLPRPKFDVMFGFACQRKSGSDMSGDTHSFLKISGNRFLLALCDGMGSGKQAEEASSRAVSLVENFYKAGFDNDTVLSSVNRLLVTNGDERFTAVDIALIDLKNGLADFIKIGSPAGMVRRGGLAEFIEGGSLPMGVLEEMRPVITKKALAEGDRIYLFSDGIQEAFGGKNNIGAFIASLELGSPQEQADAIMKRALELSPEPKDDMTVIASAIVATEKL